MMINPYANFTQNSTPLSHSSGRNENIHRHQKYDRRDKPYDRRRSRSPDRKRNDRSDRNRNDRNGRNDEGGRNRDHFSSHRGRY